MDCAFMLLLCFSLSGAVAKIESAVQPLSIPPSLFWDGDDGWWSTFHVQVGNPPQTLRVLSSTSASAGTVLWVIMDLGCSAVNPTLANCDDRRGGLFSSNDSNSWSTVGLQNGVDGAIYTLNTFEESLLNRQGNGSYGYDTVILGSNGQNLPELQKQLLAQIWTNDFFLGSLGLSPWPFNFTDFQDPQPSIIGMLHNSSLIPSLSWAYTAGAHYQNPETFGSLTLGGYDASRFVPNNVSFPFGADFSRDLVVGLQSITYNTEGAKPLLTKASGVVMYIDSMVPEVWLPTSVCQQFEQKFNLTWHESAQLYTVNEDAHQALSAQNPAFTFTLGQPGDLDGDNGTTEIVLPYAAFDLNLTAPIVGNDTRWFPLKQAQNESQYTLGRTFLQEAYLMVDYERRNFSVSQALFPSTSVQQELVAIDPPSAESRNTSVHLSAGAIVGIAMAALGVVSGSALIAWACVRRRRRQRQRQKQASETAPFRENKLPLNDAKEVDSSETAVLEVDGSNPVKPELVAHEGAHGRHEMLVEEGVKEIVGWAVPVELEASALDVQRANRG